MDYVNFDDELEALDATEKAYVGLHEAMTKFYEEKNYKRAFEIATKLVMV